MSDEGVDADMEEVLFKAMGEFLWDDDDDMLLQAMLSARHGKRMSASSRCTIEPSE